MQCIPAITNPWLWVHDQDPLFAFRRLFVPIRHYSMVFIDPQLHWPTVGQLADQKLSEIIRYWAPFSIRKSQTAPNEQHFPHRNCLVAAAASNGPAIELNVARSNESMCQPRLAQYGCAGRRCNGTFNASSPTQRVTLLSNSSEWQLYLFHSLARGTSATSRPVAIAVI